MLLFGTAVSVLVVGLVAGSLARLLLRHRTLLTWSEFMVAGIAGSALAGLVTEPVVSDPHPADWRVLLASLGYSGVFMGGDAVNGDPGFLQQVVSKGGLSAADNTYGSQPYRDISTLTTGKAARFLHEYHARYPGQSINAYAADAYDAAMVLITAIRQLIQTRQPVTRSALIDAVQHIQYSGVTGPISFDTNGDISHSVFSVYGVKSGNWDFIQQVST